MSALGPEQTSLRVQVPVVDHPVGAAILCFAEAFRSSKRQSQLFC
jgi:hypothetical protein